MESKKSESGWISGNPCISSGKPGKKGGAQLFLELGIIALAAGQPVLVFREEEPLTTTGAGLPDFLD